MTPSDALGTNEHDPGAAGGESAGESASGSAGKSTRQRGITVETAASRSEAYVYGNLLILAALAIVTPEEAESGHGALVVIGTGISTYIAHVFAASVAHRIRSGDHPASHDFRVEIRNAVPIASSAVGPTLVMLVALAGWIPGEWAIPIAILTIVGRFLYFGSLVSRLSGKKSSWRSMFAGIGMAATGLVIAAIKILLTH